MKKLLIILLLLISMQGISQTKVFETKSGYFTIQQPDSVGDKPTGKYYTDSKGQKWPVYISKNGKIYAWRLSKNGNLYKQYLRVYVRPE